MALAPVSMRAPGCGAQEAGVGEVSRACGHQQASLSTNNEKKDIPAGGGESTARISIKQGIIQFNGARCLDQNLSLI